MKKSGDRSKGSCYVAATFEIYVHMFSTDSHQLVLPIDRARLVVQTVRMSGENYVSSRVTRSAPVD